MTFSESESLGAEVGRVVARIAHLTFPEPGFFADATLAVRPERPWSQQLVDVAVECTAGTPPDRLDPATRTAWVDLCRRHAPALEAVDGHAQLVHADINPKKILVPRTPVGWRVDAILDWEFSYSGSPYGDAANMSRFGADHPAGFQHGFQTGYAASQPHDLPLLDDWAYLGCGCWTCLLSATS